MPTERDDLTGLLKQLEGEPWTRWLRRSDPRHGDLVRRLSSSANSLAEAIDELSQLPLDNPKRGNYADVLRMAKELAANVGPTTIETDIDRVFDAAGLNQFQRQFVARRLGWDGEGGTTLEAAANGQLTRERVRQLEQRVRSASRMQSLPAIEVALELLAARAPIAADAAAELLATEGLARPAFDPIGLINAARLSGFETPVSLAAGVVYAGEQREHPNRIGEAVRKLVSNQGATSVNAIAESLDDPRLDADAVRRVLALDPQIRWLDNEREWLFVPTGKNRAATILRKMLAVASSLSLSDVREGMRRYRDREISLPRPVLRELCKCFEWVRVDGDQILASRPLDYRLVLEHTEETLVDIFREHGPVLDRATTVDLGEQYGLDRTTTGLYLGWSPIIERITTNRYALRGTDVPAGTLEAMRGTLPRRRVQRGYGWTSNGRLWVGYTLSQAVIDSHVVGVPGALKDELRGRFQLAAPNENLGELATGGGNLWGLSRVLKRYAAEAGDAFVVEFDLAARRAYAVVGGQELFDSENRPEQVLDEPVAEEVDDAPSERTLDENKEPRSISYEGFKETTASTDGGEPALDELLPLRPAFDDPQLGLLAAFEPAADASAVRSVGASEEAPDLDPRESESADAADREVGQQSCVVPGCAMPGKHKLGVRCRVWHEPSPIPGKSKTSALWAPDSDAFLCDKHALGGAHITLIFEPNNSGETALKVIASPHGEDRRTRIRHEPRMTGSTKPSAEDDPPHDPDEEGATEISLTKIESELLSQLASSGAKTAELANDRGVAEQTIKFHLTNIYRKIGVDTRTEAVVWAQKHGLA